MTVGYHQRCNGSSVPDYACQGEGISTGTPACQNVCGSGVDAAVGALVLEQLTPLAIEAAFQVSEELAKRAAEADRIRMKGVERARYAAEAARRRYLAVDPTNRLVAETLEADWNHKLREVVDAEDDYERSRNAAATVFDQEHRDRVRALAEDLPALWNDPDTPMRERKRLIRLLVTDVTLIRGHQLFSAPLAQSLLCFGQEAPAPIERIGLAAPVSHGLVLHPPAAFVELGVGQLHQMERISHLNGVGHHRGEDLAVRARQIQGGVADLVPPLLALALQPG
jgi:hypothetical protein